MQLFTALPVASSLPCSPSQPVVLHPHLCCCYRSVTAEMGVIHISKTSAKPFGFAHLLPVQCCPWEQTGPGILSGVFSGTASGVVSLVTGRSLFLMLENGHKSKRIKTLMKLVGFLLTIKQQMPSILSVMLY